jgi:DNA primase
MQVLKAESERLATTGLATEEARARYRELMQKQEQLRRGQDPA